MRYDLIHRGSSWNVTRFAHLVLFVGTEEPSVVSFLHHHKGYARLISNLQAQTGLPDGSQFVVEDVVELALANAVSVVDDACGLEVGVAIELEQQILNHGEEILDNFLTVGLHTHCSRVATWVGVHTRHNRGYARLCLVTYSRTQKNEVGIKIKQPLVMVK